MPEEIDLNEVEEAVLDAAWESLRQGEGGARRDRTQLSLDADGREHKPKGEGGGQFTGKGVGEFERQTVNAVKGANEGNKAEKPASAAHVRKLIADPEALETHVEEKVNGIFARFKNAVIPAPIRAAADKVSKKLTAILASRYGERSAGIILKVAAISAGIPAPGTQPLAIAGALVIAEMVRGWKKLRGTQGGEKMSLTEPELSEEEILAAAYELLASIRQALAEDTGEPLEEDPDQSEEEVQLSLDRSPIESADPVLDDIATDGARAALTISDMIRQKVRRLARKKYPPRS